MDWWGGKPKFTSKAKILGKKKDCTMSKGHGSQSERSPTGQTGAIQAKKYIT